jgi:DNA mismatch repair protein MSH6
MKYEFLKPEKIRDANKKKKDDPEYNPHTLFVPEDFKKNLTPVGYLILTKNSSKKSLKF